MQRNEPIFAERRPFQKLESIASAVLVALPIVSQVVLPLSAV